jgi:serine protease Do
MLKIKRFSLSTCEALQDDSCRRQFYEPIEGRPFSPFLIQDPFGLRNAIVPVFRQELDGRMYGMGTAFHIDGFGNFLTAHHVVDFVDGDQQNRPILFLSMHAIVFGTFRIPSDCFAPIDTVFTSMIKKDDPLANLRGISPLYPEADISVLKLSKIGPSAKRPQTLPVRLQGLPTKVGDIVLAIGFPKLDLSEIDNQAQAKLLTEGMYGAYGRIVKIHQNGRGELNRMPVFEVECDWPSGMSGGPVFNQNGEVIGMVSRSIRFEDNSLGVGYAAHFGLCPALRAITPTLDISNPGWRRCWGVFKNAGGELISMHQLEEEAVNALRADQSYQSISNQIGTDNYIYMT